MKVSTIYRIVLLISLALVLVIEILNYFHLGIDNRQREIDYRTVTCQYGR